jgi:hypothetical protein
MSVELHQHEPGRDLQDFIQFPHRLYRDDPAWIPPLNLEVAERLTPGKNPFFEHADVALFTARQGAEVVGRISAQIDHEHLRVHGDKAGFFGFFDTVKDGAVAATLVDAAAAWLAERGMTWMRGPFSLSINEELGMLVDGFDTPPAMMMQHHRPYQGGLAEDAGLYQVQDLYAWSYRVAAPTPRAARARQVMDDLPEVRFRSLDRRRLRFEIATALDIFNDAWRDNWAFVPPTAAEADKLAADLRLVIDPGLSFFVEIDGRPVAMVICLPNLNEVTRDFSGRLTPLNLLKLAWRLKIRRPKTARLMMLGIRTELRGAKRYGPLSTALYAEVTARGLALGYEWAELSWTLAENRPINLGIERMGAEIYKQYRIYEKRIQGAG